MSNVVISKWLQKLQCIYTQAKINMYIYCILNNEVTGEVTKCLMVEFISF